MADDEQEESRRPSGRSIALIVLALLLGWFFLANVEDTDITFFFWDVNAPLFVALLVSAMLGVAVGFVVGRARYKT